MNSVRMIVSHVEVCPAFRLDPVTKLRSSVEAKFWLTVWQHPKSTPIDLSTIHIPKELLRFFSDGDISEICYETLRFESFANRLLPEITSMIVLAIKTKSGDVIEAIPSKFLHWRRVLLLCGVSAILGSLGMLIRDVFPVISALILVTGFFVLSIRHDIPYRHSL